MAIDRSKVIGRPEKLLRQGRLDAVIVEYKRVLADFPHDWTTANALGDCYYRAHQADKAVEQYVRIANHLMQDGAAAGWGALPEDPEDPARPRACVAAGRVDRLGAGRGRRGEAMAVDARRASAAARRCRWGERDPDADRQPRSRRSRRAPGCHAQCGGDWRRRPAHGRAARPGRRVVRGQTR